MNLYLARERSVLNVNIDYKEAIIKAVNDSLSLTDLYDTTAIFKAQGLRQSDAYDILTEVRKMFKNEDETKEDLILELMDFVVGYCHPKFSIWDSVIKN